MKKLLKLLAWLVGALVALVVALAIVLPLLIDPNDYKDDLTRLVQEKTGRELLIRGDIELSVFPWLGVELPDVSLSNAAGFEAPHMLAIKQLDVRAKLLPLLRGELEVGTLVLHGLQLNLARNADGVSNWDDLVARFASNSESPPPADDTPESAPPTLALGGVEILDAAITYTDAQASRQFTVAPLNLELGEFRFGVPASLHLDAGLAMANPAVQLKLALDGELLADPAAQQFGFANAVLQLTAKGAELPVSPLDAQLHWLALTADLAAQTAQWQAVQLTLAGLQLNLDAQVSELGSGTPQVSGKLAVAAFSPAELLAALQLPTPERADPATLGHAAFTAVFAATPNSVELAPLTLALDDTTVKGRLAVTDFATQALRFDLAVDTLDADRYLPPATEDAPEAAESGALDDIRLPVEPVRALNVDGAMHIGTLKLAGLELDKIDLTLAAHDGRLHLAPVQASLYSGSYQGDIQYDVSGTTPQLAVTQELRGVQIGELLTALFDINRFSGAANLAMQLSAAGATVGDLRRSLDGTVSLALNDGALEGANLWESITGAYAQFRGTERKTAAGVPTGQTNRTPITEMSMSLQVQDGVARNDDLKARLPFLAVTGAGRVDLVREALDYRLQAKVLGTAEAHGLAGMDELTGLTIPVHLTGSFDAIGFETDIGAALKAKTAAQVDAAKAAARERAEQARQATKAAAEKKAQELREAEEAAKEKARQKLKDRLKGLGD